MCNQWALKQMECGHLERDMAVVPCEAYRQLSMSAVPPAQQPPCPIRFHPGARPCITVDGRCGECRAKAAIDQQWQVSIRGSFFTLCVCLGSQLFLMETSAPETYP
ncbi:hypothetical protein F4779DRAFT_583564 [Xylariaceae sp. FL0662B]|nr:hypothetical protein F4779DRAFT_583564 [Xylariaceae sp. FL0662B]